MWAACAGPRSQPAYKRRACAWAPRRSQIRRLGHPDCPLVGLPQWSCSLHCSMGNASEHPGMEQMCSAVKLHGDPVLQSLCGLHKVGALTLPRLGCHVNVTPSPQSD